jgi:regulatory protein
LIKGSTPASKTAAPGAKKVARKTPRKMTQSRLNNIADYYVQRYATSHVNLRRVLLRRADKALRVHGGDREEVKQWIEEIVTRMTRSGILDDARFALGRAVALRRLGRSPTKIRAQLASKGVERSIIDAALSETAVTESGEDAALDAARAYAQRRRLGPFNDKPTAPEDARALYKKHLSALARAGFTYDVARRVLEAEND